jgi:predicted RNA-binding Zn-ribbon protein involved in translation (DUF1610 family)
MTVDSNDRPQLRCVSCGYDLRGLSAKGTAFDCPECGTVNELTAIIEDNQRRQRTVRDVMSAAAVGLLIIGGLIVGGTLLSLLDLSDNRTAQVAFVGGFFICWFAGVQFYYLSHGTAIFIALVTSALMTASIAMQSARAVPLVLLYLWIVGFVDWARRK